MRYNVLRFSAANKPYLYKSHWNYAVLQNISNSFSVLL